VAAPARPTDAREGLNLTPPINRSTPPPRPGTIGRMFRHAFLSLPSAVADALKAAVDAAADDVHTDVLATAAVAVTDGARS
jgi:hypothetical protein